MLQSTRARHDEVVVYRHGGLIALSHKSLNDNGFKLCDGTRLKWPETPTIIVFDCMLDRIEEASPQSSNFARGKFEKLLIISSACGVCQQRRRRTTK